MSTKRKGYSYFLIKGGRRADWRIVAIPNRASDTKGFRSRYPDGDTGVLWSRSESKTFGKRVSRKRALQIVPDHVAAGIGFKKTLDGDAAKGAQ